MLYQGLVQNLLRLRHAENHERFQRINLRGVLRRVLRGLSLPCLRGSRQILIARKISPAIRQRIVFAVSNLHFDLSIAAIHLRIVGRIRNGVEITALVRDLANNSRQIILVVERLAAGLAGQHVHGRIA